MIKRKLESYLKCLASPGDVIISLGRRRLLDWVPDKYYLLLVFKYKLGYKLNLGNPQTFNEKLQWMKLYDRNPDYNIYVDKYLVRKYIENVIGRDYLIPLLGKYDCVDDINWDILPNKFVVKCTHGSHTNIICLDKNELNIEDSKRQLKIWMTMSWFWATREWPYKDLTPKIICEEFISNNGNPPEDFKVLCFNGEPKFIEVHQDRMNNHSQDIYDIEWNLTNITQGKTGQIMDKPKLLDEMLRLSRVLSQGLRHVRVDWYIVDNKLFFGELTFFDGAGFVSFDHYEHDLLLGQCIDLNI